MANSTEANCEKQISFCVLLGRDKRLTETSEQLLNALADKMK